MIEIIYRFFSDVSSNDVKQRKCCQNRGHHDLNKFSFQQVHRAAIVQNQRRCSIWGNYKSNICRRIVIGVSGFTIYIWQAISVSIICITIKSIGSWLAAHVNMTWAILPDNILVIIWGKIFNCCRIWRVPDPCTA